VGISRFSKKQYIIVWAAFGLLFPVAMVLIGRFGDKLPGFVFAPMIPLMFIAVVLTNAGLPPAIVSVAVLSLNVVFYAVVGWVSWPMVALLSRRQRRKTTGDLAPNS
jgi:hypothetical protein